MNRALTGLGVEEEDTVDNKAIHNSSKGMDNREDTHSKGTANNRAVMGNNRVGDITHLHLRSVVH